MGNLFQISDRATLREKEDEIISRLSKVIETIIDKEHDARQMLIQKKSNTLWDQIVRASWRADVRARDDLKEALNLLSSLEAQDRSRGVPGRSAPADRRALHRDAAGPFYRRALSRS